MAEEQGQKCPGIGGHLLNLLFPDSGREKWQLSHPRVLSLTVVAADICFEILFYLPLQDSKSQRDCQIQS